MFEFNDIKLTSLATGSGFMVRERDGHVHCKTTPYIIFAQAYVGHYELTANGQTWVMEPGEAFFTPPNIPLAITHKVELESGVMRMRWLHFNLSLMGNIPLEDMFEFPFRVNREISDQLAGPIDELQKISDVHTIESASKKNQLFYTCFNHLMPLLKPLKKLNEFKQLSPQLLPLLDYINQNIHHPISIEDLTARGHVSRSGLSRLFASAFNTSPYRYILRLRLEKIAESLRNSSASIAEIADEFNYPNQFLLSRQFKKQYGVSPQLYRQQQVWKYDPV